MRWLEAVERTGRAARPSRARQTCRAGAFACHLIFLTTQLHAANAPAVPVTAIKQIEAFIDASFAADPWDTLGDTRGTYLQGYGAVFTFEMSLVHVNPITPFNPVIPPEEIKSVHERKVKQLAVLKTTMHEMLAKAAATLTTLPPDEQITFEALFFSQAYEDHTGLPRRLTMTANKQKLLDATAHHASAKELALLVQEWDQ